MLKIAPYACAATTAALYARSKPARCDGSLGSGSATQEKTSTIGIIGLVKTPNSAYENHFKERDVKQINSPEKLSDLFKKNPPGKLSDLLSKQPNSKQTKRKVDEGQKTNAGNPPSSTSAVDTIVNGTATYLAYNLLENFTQSACSSLFGWVGNFHCNKDDQQCDQAWRNGRSVQVCSKASQIGITLLYAKATNQAPNETHATSQPK